MALSVLDLFSVGIGPDHASDKAVVQRRRKSLPVQPNGMTFKALNHADPVIRERSYYSIGTDRVVADETGLPYPFVTADELLDIRRREDMSIDDVMLANELVWRTEAELREKLLNIWAVMRECADNGCAAEGIITGGLNVTLRAPSLFKTFTATDATLQGVDSANPLLAMEWVNLVALAVNEENAAGGRIPAAPANGAAGIVPAVLHYCLKFVPGANDDGVVRLLLAADTGLCDVLDGTPRQVEKAAEVGIEHNLGLTCDPVGGLVRIPCIEWNAIASVKAIKTMRRTGVDMKTKYKETSRGGPAVNVIEC